MGTVWRARDEVLHREVAVKEVRAPAGLPSAKVERLYTRLEREAWAAARVTARNVITVHDVVNDEGRPWIVMELVRGRSLADRLQAEGSLAPREAARIGAEVLAALRAAHEAGVLHRDVKPANVLLADDGRVVLSDFGIAVIQGDTALTMTGEVVGSPEYLAPERALGRMPGPASDLWSLGVLLYAAVQGRSPFRHSSALTTLRAVVDDEPSVPHRAGALVSVIEGLLRKDPDQRTSLARTAEDLRLVAAGGTPGADLTATDTVDLPTEGVGTDAPTQSHDDVETATTDVPTVTTETRADAPAGTSAGTGGTSAGTGGTSAPTAVASTAPAPTAAATVAHTPAEASPPAVVSPHTVVSPPAAVSPPPVAPQGPPPHPVAPPTASTAAMPATAASTPPGTPQRSRRTLYALVAAGSALVLLLGGLGYALTSGDTDQGDNGVPTAGSGSPSPQNPDTVAGSDEANTAADLPVKVSVTGANLTYAGSCPTPQGQAPSFTATFEATELPARFTYRWVSTGGQVVDRTWRALSFVEGGPRTHQETVRVTTWAEAGTLSTAMGVEFKASTQTVSDTVPFSITCQ
ncbi:serine/threonine-protein kinase [Streptomyces sp. NPDC127033]|uniref:serine/threonine-protein kinase n=1 Tax=Streptomyces sp. NPDC127033 TaxID=3347110 RepID=UPI003656A199